MHTATPLDHQVDLSGSQIIELCSTPGHPLAQKVVDSLVLSAINEGGSVVWLTSNKSVPTERWAFSRGKSAGSGVGVGVGVGPAASAAATSASAAIKAPDSQTGNAAMSDSRTDDPAALASDPSEGTRASTDTKSPPGPGKVHKIHIPSMAFLIVALRNTLVPLILHQNVSLVVIDDIASLLHLSTGPYSSLETVATGTTGSAKNAILELHRCVSHVTELSHANVVLLDSYVARYADTSAMQFEVELQRKQEHEFSLMSQDGSQTAQETQNLKRNSNLLSRDNPMTRSMQSMPPPPCPPPVQPSPSAPTAPPAPASSSNDSLRNLKELVPYLKWQGPPKMQSNVRLQFYYKRGVGHCDVTHRP